MMSYIYICVCDFGWIEIVSPVHSSPRYPSAQRHVARFLHWHPSRSSLLGPASHVIEVATAG